MSSISLPEYLLLLSDLGELKEFGLDATQRIQLRAAVKDAGKHLLSSVDSEKITENIGNAVQKKLDGITVEAVTLRSDLATAKSDLATAQSELASANSAKDVAERNLTAAENAARDAGKVEGAATAAAAVTTAQNALTEATGKLALARTRHGLVKTKLDDLVRLKNVPRNIRKQKQDARDTAIDALNNAVAAKASANGGTVVTNDKGKVTTLTASDGTDLLSTTDAINTDTTWDAEDTGRIGNLRTAATTAKTQYTEFIQAIADANDAVAGIQDIVNSDVEYVEIDDGIAVGGRRQRGGAGTNVVISSDQFRRLLAALGTGSDVLDNVSKVLDEIKTSTSNVNSWFDTIHKMTTDVAAKLTAAQAPDFGSGKIKESFDKFALLGEGEYPQYPPLTKESDIDICKMSGFNETNPTECFNVFNEITKGTGTMTERVKALTLTFNNKPRAEFVKLMIDKFDIKIEDGYTEDIDTWSARHSVDKNEASCKKGLKYLLDLFNYIDTFYSQIQEQTSTGKHGRTLANMSNFTQRQEPNKLNMTISVPGLIRMSKGGGKSTMCNDLMNNRMFGGRIAKNIIPMAGGDWTLKQIEQEKNNMDRKLTAANLKLSPDTNDDFNKLLNASKVIDGRLEKFLVILDGFVNARAELMKHAEKGDDYAAQEDIKLEAVINSKTALIWVNNNIAKLKKCLEDGNEQQCGIKTKISKVVKTILGKTQ
jgi:hypothetical protein